MTTLFIVFAAAVIVALVWPLLRVRKRTQGGDGGHPGAIYDGGHRDRTHDGDHDSGGDGGGGGD